MSGDHTADISAQPVKVDVQSALSAERKRLERLEQDMDATVAQAYPDQHSALSAARSRVQTLEKVAQATSRRVALSEWGSSRYEVGKAPQIEWLIKDTFALGEAVMLAASGDAGKGMMALNLALHVAAPSGWSPGTQRTPFGKPCMSRGRAVVLAGEDSFRAIHRRLDALDPDGKVRQAERLYVVPMPSVGGAISLVRETDGELVSTDEWSSLEEQLHALGDVRLVVLDPLSAFAGGLDINTSPTVGQRLCNALSTLAEKLSATVVLCHHMRKGNEERGTIDHETARERIRGTTGLVDGLRAAYALLPLNGAQAAPILKALGKRGAFDVGRIYWGALVKSNNPADRSERLYVRHESTGLLEDLTEEVRQRMGQTVSELVGKRKRAGTDTSSQGNVHADRRVEPQPSAPRMPIQGDFGDDDDD